MDVLGLLNLKESSNDELNIEVNDDFNQIYIRQAATDPFVAESFSFLQLLNLNGCYRTSTKEARPNSTNN